MMGRIELPDELSQFIDRQIAEGRVESEADFVFEAVRRFAEALELHEEEINVAAQDGIADIEAGRFELISGPDDMTRLQAELTAILDCVEKQHRLASG